MGTLVGEDTMVACWRALARLSPGAEVVRTERTVTALFPSWAPLNNAILLGSTTTERASGAAAGLRSAYQDVDVTSWALWLPSPLTDLGDPDPVGVVHGMTRDTTTLVMTVTLGPGLPSHPAVVRTSIEAATLATDEPVPVAELSAPVDVPGLQGWVLVLDGAAVAGAWSYLQGTDCGIYAVGTVPGRRRRGLAAALVRHVLADAWRHGARTASLQSTAMGQRLYESLGFTAVGRYDEWVPTTAAGTQAEAVGT
jgi:GNAT superfamily N-acetyltransferase